ncbi:helix-turn-helix domain-containing protein [Polycladidibacter hongkongensis]|uniref:helix-turn-helix domain-containing protein n=1 Tax=Polycladidibacter hongkongensis TaxID=1647556 RepID=UPI00082EAEDA|nr:helix-turn-helix domain-containing protein [Pseudovibrio hongkongensis]
MAKTYRVVALAYSGLCLFEYSMAYEVFGLPRPEFAGDWFSFETVAVDPAPLIASNGMEFFAKPNRAALKDADVIIVPGWRDLAAKPPADLIAVLQDAAAKGTRVASICSGAFLLAQAGLLNGKSATTHWRYADEFIASFPEINYKANTLYVECGFVLTSAGSAAGLDLCLHITRLFYGQAKANAVAKRLVVPSLREGFQVQVHSQPVLPENPSKRLQETIEYQKANLQQAYSIAELAEHAGMSRRTFLRKFKEHLGQPPGEWIRGLRLQKAQELLETHYDMGLDAVAFHAGFNSAITLRHHFKRHLGISPSTYRQQYRLTRA